MLRTSPFCFTYFTRGILLACCSFVLALLSEVSAQLPNPQLPNPQRPAAQVPGVTLQLPTIRVRQFRSSFSVPDGGTISLGGGANRSVGSGSRSFSGGRANASARVLVMKELEREILADAKQASGLTHRQLNGSPEIQAKADFITRHIDRLSR